MPALNRIKNLSDSNPTLLQMLRDYIFGTKELKPYNPAKTYNKGDVIIAINDITGKIEMLQCIRNAVGGVTGEYIPEDWEHTSVVDYLGGSVPLGDTVILDASEPVNDPTNFIWLQIKDIKTTLDPDQLLINNNMLIFDAAGVVGQDETPAHPEDVKVWFDYEPAP